jgi:aminopeptidase N
MDNLDQAKSAYGAIVYNKAPSVLKQLNFLVGDSAFQLGIRAFLGAHAYANATWQDLLGAIGKAWGGDLLAGFGKNFMLRPGMPVVETRLAVQRGAIVSLDLVQHPAQPALSGNGPWPMKAEVLLAYGAAPPVRLPVTLSGATTTVKEAQGRPAPLFAFPNAGDYGYFLSLLDTLSVSALEHGALSRIDDGLLRAMLWGALWDQVRAARLDPESYARLVLRELPGQSDEQLVPALLGRLERAIRAYLPP